MKKQYFLIMAVVIGLLVVFMTGCVAPEDYKIDTVTVSP